jgi:hypothetical protein
MAHNFIPDASKRPLVSLAPVFWLTSSTSFRCPTSFFNPLSLGLFSWALLFRQATLLEPLSMSFVRWACFV